jgi:hypothetical protein
MRRALLALSALAVFAACGDDGPASADAGADVDEPRACESIGFGPAAPIRTLNDPPNERTDALTLYELQIRSANACRTELGSEAQRAACAAKVAPVVTYNAEDSTCGLLGTLESIRLGTIEDLGEDTADFRQGITLRYIAERVGANGIWIMPPFPNNDIRDLPDPCDNLGSPYAVRDYMHVSGRIARDCIIDGRDEYSTEPCWGDDAFATMIAQAHDRGLTVLVDVAFNHLGHDYRIYDYADHIDILDLVARHGDDGLWDFDATFDAALVNPEVLDTTAELDALAAASPADAALLAEVDDRCPALAGDARVRAFHAWRLAFDGERSNFDCNRFDLEYAVPGFLLGRDTVSPATGTDDTWTNSWRDVSFIYHHGDNPAHRDAFLRQREYLFRVLNHLVAMGVDGFRLDHATDATGGMNGEEWTYLIEKVSYYAALRGQERPIFLAEEFDNQAEMVGVADIMTEGYLFGITGRYGRIKDGPYIEGILANADRFDFRTRVLAHLENHDELRLVDQTGFDPWTGAGFWALGAASWTTPMMLVGQEFGQPYRLEFKRSHAILGRFEGTDAYRGDADALVDFYREIIEFRNSEAGEPLRSPNRRFLRRPIRGSDPRLVAFVRWDDDGDALLAVHNLWSQDALADYALPSDVAAAIGMQPCERWRAVDALAGTVVVDCREALDWTRSFPVRMPASRRLAWARFERCD